MMKRRSKCIRASISHTVYPCTVVDMHARSTIWQSDRGGLAYDSVRMHEGYRLRCKDPYKVNKAGGPRTVGARWTMHGREARTCGTHGG